MMTCPHCNNLVANGESICAVCGRSVEMPPVRPQQRPPMNIRSGARLNFEMTSTPERNYGNKLATTMKVISIIVSVLVGLGGVAAGIYLCVLTDIELGLPLIIGGLLAGLIVCFLLMIGVTKFRNIMYTAYNTEKDYMIAENQSRMMMQTISDLQVQSDALMQMVPALQNLLSEQRAQSKYIEQQSSLMQQFIARQDDGNISLQQATAAVKSLIVIKENGEPAMAQADASQQLLGEISQKLDKLIEAQSASEPAKAIDEEALMAKLDEIKSAWNEAAENITDTINVQADNITSGLTDTICGHIDTVFEEQPIFAEEIVDEEIEEVIEMADEVQEIEEGSDLYDNAVEDEACEEEYTPEPEIEQTEAFNETAELTVKAETVEEVQDDADDEGFFVGNIQEDADVLADNFAEEADPEDDFDEEEPEVVPEQVSDDHQIYAMEDDIAAEIADVVNDAPAADVAEVFDSESTVILTEAEKFDWSQLDPNEEATVILKPEDLASFDAVQIEESDDEEF